MVVQSILHFVLQECNRTKTSFILNKTKHMNHGNLSHFKYLGKTLNNNYDAWIIRHMHVKGLTMEVLTLSNARAMTLAMV